MKPEQCIAIAGGGLLGRLCAWQLASQGHDVTVFEAGDFDQPAGACWTAAGMISPLSELVAADAGIFKMGMQGLKIWPQWISRLQAQTDRHVDYAESGSLLVAHTLDDAELDQFYDHLIQALSRVDLNCTEKLSDGATAGPGQVRWVTEAEIRNLEPHLAQQFQRGLYLSPEAHVHSRGLLTALLVAMECLGVKMVAHTPVMCEPAKVLVEGKAKHFDWVIDVRGLGAADQLPNLRGVRGEVMIVETSEVKLKRPVRLLHPRYKLYVVPRPDNQYIIGATEIESDDMSPVSLQSTLELGSALYSLNPAFAEARVLESRANCRPALPDNLPRIDVEPGIVRANGLFRHGYLLSPVVVNRVLAIINKEQSNVA